MLSRAILLVFALAGLVQAQQVVVVSAATFDADFPVAPESIASAFGQNLAPGTEAATTTPLPTSLQGVSVTLIDSAGASHVCPLFFVSPGQINFVIPAAVATGTAQVNVGPSAAALLVEGGVNGAARTGTVEIASVSTGLFSVTELAWMSGFVLRVDADGTQTYLPTVEVNASNEIVPVPVQMSPGGDESALFYLVMYGTGNRGSGDLAQVETYIGYDEFVGESPNDLIPTFYNGPQGDYIGLDQTNAGPFTRRLEWFGGGDRAMYLCVDGDCSNLVWIEVAPNPNAPVISAPAFQLQDEVTPRRMRYEFDIQDADGDIEPFFVVWAWEDDRRICQTSLQVPIQGLGGKTGKNRVNFTVAKENGLVLGPIERVTFSVQDGNNHVSNIVEYIPDPPGSLPGFRENCQIVIDKQ